VAETGETVKNKINSHLDFTPPALRDVSAKVAKVGGINLGQGVCQMPVPPLVSGAARTAIDLGHNLYSPAQGVPALRDALSERLNSFNAIPCSADNIIVTTGATGAFEAICSVFLKAGDEVVTFIPFYPYHRNPLVKMGVTVRYVKLSGPEWNFDPAELAAACTDRTKFILVNTPNNPTGKVFTRSELETIARLSKERDIFCVTDEVYEYMTYDDRKHISMASLPGMFERTITMGSYSKTFAVTGWRVGYLLAPLPVVDPLKTLFDQIYVCSPTPLQHGVAAGIEGLGQEYYDWLHAEFSRKRDLMKRALLGAGIEPVVPQGAYYMLGRIEKRFPGLSSEEAVEVMIAKAGVGAVPASDFLGPEVKGDATRSNFLRFCYAVPDERIVEAGQRLAGV
jgi:aminotransferase